MKLEYIKANGNYYQPQKAGVKAEHQTFGNHPVCIIKKLWFGRWQIDHYDDYTQFHTKNVGYGFGDEDKPNQRIILYPAGIEEISWVI